MCRYRGLTGTPARHTFTRFDESALVQVEVLFSNEPTTLTLTGNGQTVVDEIYPLYSVQVWRTDSECAVAYLCPCGFNPDLSYPVSTSARWYGASHRFGNCATIMPTIATGHVHAWKSREEWDATIAAGNVSVSADTDCGTFDLSNYVIPPGVFFYTEVDDIVVDVEFIVVGAVVGDFVEQFRATLVTPGISSGLPINPNLSTSSHVSFTHRTLATCAGAIAARADDVPYCSYSYSGAVEITPAICQATCPNGSYSVDYSF